MALTQKFVVVLVPIEADVMPVEAKTASLTGEPTVVRQAVAPVYNWTVVPLSLVPLTTTRLPARVLVGEAGVVLVITGVDGAVLLTV